MYLYYDCNLVSDPKTLIENSQTYFESVVNDHTDNDRNRTDANSNLVEKRMYIPVDPEVPEPSFEKNHINCGITKEQQSTRRR